MQAASPLPRRLGRSKKSGRSNWSKNGGWAGWNEKRAAARRVNRDAIVAALQHADDLPDDRVENRPASALRDSLQTLNEHVHMLPLHDLQWDSSRNLVPGMLQSAQVETADKCVGESVWGDAFVWRSIFDLP